MKEILEKIESFKKKSEHDIASEFRTIFPRNGEEAPMELKAETMAFDFTEHDCPQYYLIILYI